MARWRIDDAVLAMGVFHYKAVLESSNAIQATYRVWGSYLDDAEAWGTMTLSTDGRCSSTGRSSAAMLRCVGALSHKVRSASRSSGVCPEQVFFVA